MPIIIPANSAVSGGFDVDNSVRFNDGDSAYMHKTAAAGNRRTFTFSTWFKRGQLGTNQQLFNSYSAANAGGFAYMQLEAIESGVIGDRISLEVYGTILLKTTQVLRDNSAWYHLVIAVDTTNGTANNRCRMYLNGTEITSFATRNNPDQNFDFAFNQNNIDMYLGSNNYGGNKGNYFDGYLAETVWIDGTQYAASDFGEFDDSGIWKPIDVSGLTFGTNGFYLNFKASGNLGNDANGGGDWTEVNLTATDQSTDTCTNNFATLNTLIPSSASFLEGNLRCNFASSGEYGSDSSIGITSGKWYAEFKFTAGANHYLILGVNDQNGQNERSRSNGSAGKGGATGTIGYRCSDGKYRVNNSHTSYGGSGGDGDIFSIAIDKDNEKVYFAVNGTYGNSGNPATNSNGIDVSSVLTGDTWFFNVGNDTGDSETQVEANFGSPSYAISSSNADGNSYGNFEYAVPSGFFSLNTKNLAENG